jgi:hypothetical protein
MSYYPANPEIARAYENDPRTKLAQIMIGNGSSGAPVAQGGYAWMDGLARALQGVAGGYITKKQGKKYEADEKDLMALYAHALGSDTAAAAPGGMEPPPVAGAAGQGGGLPSATPDQPPVPQMVPQAPQAAPQGLDPLAPLPDTGQPKPAPVAAQIASVLGAPAPDISKPYYTPKAQPAAYVRPVNGKPTSMFGKRGNGFHNGEDFDGVIGDPVHAVLGGTVQIAGPSKGPSGTMVRIKYDNGESGGYAHLSAVDVKPGQRIEAGDVIGAVGNTGRVRSATGDGSHLHYTHRDASGKLVDPASLPFGKPSAAPAQVASATALPPEPPTPDTPEPELPPMPNRPAVRPGVQSRRLAAGQELMQSGNRYAFNNALRMVEEGMGEQFKSDADVLASERDLDRTGYDAALGDAYGARGAKRNAAYDARGDERRNRFETARQTRQFGHEDASREDEQSFTAGQSATDRTFRAGQSELDRAAQEKLTRMTIEGRHQDAVEKRQAKMQNFLSTPQGTKMYNEVANRISQNDDIIANLQSFVTENEKTDTGGIMLNTPGASWLDKTVSPSLQRMDAITNKIAPVMRQAGQGSMSDKDLAGFKTSVTNIYASRSTNKATADRLTKGFQRINDFEMQRMQAAAEGRQAEFMREWSIFRARVPIQSGQSFDDWKASIPSYDSAGNKK